MSTQDVRTIRQFRNLRKLWVAAMVLACFSSAVAQARYKVQDQGVQHPDNLGMAMGLNNHGWTLIMDQSLDHSVTSTQFPAVSGTVRISIRDLNIPLGTLGGKNSSINWNGINDSGEAVGMSETSVPDPSGEDLCTFGTHATCLPFIWQNGVMRGLPRVGGRNGQASAINNSGQVVGYAENGMVDGTCTSNIVNNRVDLPVLWDTNKGKDKAHALSLIGNDTDGIAFGVNDKGQAVGFSGTCLAVNFAVLWENNAATPLPDLGTPGAIAYAINSHSQIVGQAVNAEGTALAAIWENDTVRSLGGLLPGDAAAFATSINNKGQAVGSAFDFNGSWARGLLWENGKMYDLNTLFPASSHLYVISASNINENGQIAGMAVVINGTNVENIVHSFLATPVDEDQGKTVADVVRTRPTISLPAANVGRQLSPKSGHCTIHTTGTF
jgi:probable HAF family extracellular repeat protein